LTENAVTVPPIGAIRAFRPRAGLQRFSAENVGPWLLAFAPTVYLGLSGGGYDIVARSEVGILLWWIVLLGVLVGVLPRARLSAPAWAAVLLFAGFLAWTWIALGWTESQERTLAEVCRVATYLGVLVLALALVSGRSVHALLSGLACAIGVVSLIAVLSRLVPGWFPADSASDLYATARLRYPFDYSDAVGEFAALGVPLLLYLATGARTLAGRALAAGALPAVALCLALTVSRGGILAAAVGLIVFYALVPDRLPRLATGLAFALATAGMMLELAQLRGVRETYGQAPAGQRHSMLLVLVLACAAVGLVQMGITLAARRTRPRWLAVPRRGAQAIGALILAAVAALVIIGIASGTDHRLWQEFKRVNPPPAHSTYFRLLSIAGSHRYQYWQVAIAAFHSSPWKGIGPGTFQFYWSQHQTIGEFVRNAHSLWIETLAELGIVGIALLGALFAFGLIAGAARGLRAPPASRLAAATAVAALAAFCAAAAFDWVWQFGVMAMIAMLLLAAALAGDGAGERADSARRRLATRVVLALAAIVALWAIAVPLTATTEVRSSQAAVVRGHFRTALADAATAQNVEPAAASPRLQRALILEQLGDLAGARQAIAQAERREPTNWRIWLVASRIATESDQPRLALDYYRRARALNPTSLIFGA
jgi:O-antigen ligase